MTVLHHALVLTNRGSQHRHPWAPACSCGLWVGVPTRRRQKAEKQYRHHANAYESLGRRRRRGLVTPQPVTPDHQLPAALRRTKETRNP